MTGLAKNTVSWQRGSGVGLAPWLAALCCLILSHCDTPAPSPASLPGAKPPSLHISRDDVVATVTHRWHCEVKEGSLASPARHSRHLAGHRGTFGTQWAEFPVQLQNAALV